MMSGGTGRGDRSGMRATRNWAWALLTLVVWVAIFFAFLLIAIARP
jgi:hypothetical protein